MEEHWNTIYTNQQNNQLSWFESSPEKSLQLVDTLPITPKGTFIDIGSGRSQLPHFMVEKGFEVSVLDISAKAIDLAKSDEPLSNEITWLVGDVCRYPFAKSKFDVWHDRAVFHFLTEEEDRRLYVENAANAVKGYLIVATFSLNGPNKCSDLKVCRL